MRFYLKYTRFIWIFFNKIDWYPFWRYWNKNVFFCLERLQTIYMIKWKLKWIYFKTLLIENRRKQLNHGSNSNLHAESFLFLNKNEIAVINWFVKLTRTLWLHFEWGPWDRWPRPSRRWPSRRRREREPSWLGTPEWLRNSTEE